VTYPTKPDAAYDYVSYQAGYPTTPLPAAQVAADFAEHKTSIDEVVEFLQVSHRSDGLLQSGVVDPQSLSTATVALIGGWTPRGTWVTATAYAASDVVEYPAASGNAYVCVTAHTSGTFATDRAADMWQSITALRPDDNIDFTGDNTFAGTSTFNDAVDINAATTFDGTTTFGAAFTATFSGNVTLDGTGKTFSAGSGVTVDLDGAAAVLVPTATAGDNDTTAASTAFVYNEFALRYGRNVLINGDFAIDQRNAGASKTLTAGAAIAYCVDRWYASCTGANVTVQQVAGTSPNPYALKFTGLAGNTGVLLGQRIEAADAAHLYNQTVYVSLQVKSSSLTSLTWTAYYANTADTFSSKTQIATGTISSISSTLASKSFSFSAGTGVTTGLCIEFTGGALLGSQTLQIENVQLEINQVTPFERVPYAERLARCKRYCVRRKATAVTQLALPGFSYITNTQQNYIDRFDVEMRAAPTFSVSATTDFYQVANATTTAATGLTLSVADKWGAFLVCANVSFGSNVPSLLASQNSSAWMQYEAEL